MKVPLIKIEIQTETACHDLFSLLLVCIIITRYKLNFEMVLWIFGGISPALLLICICFVNMLLHPLARKKRHLCSLWYYLVKMRYLMMMFYQSLRFDLSCCCWGMQNVPEVPRAFWPGRLTEAGSGNCDHCVPHPLLGHSRFDHLPYSIIVAFDNLR